MEGTEEEITQVYLVVGVHVAFVVILWGFL